MISMTLTAKEITYLIVAMRTYQGKLRETIDEEMGDEYDDLLMADYLLKRLTEAKTAAETAND